MGVSTSLCLQSLCRSQKWKRERMQKELSKEIQADKNELAQLLKELRRIKSAMAELEQLPATELALMEEEYLMYDERRTALHFEIESANQSIKSGESYLMVLKKSDTHEKAERRARRIARVAPTTCKQGLAESYDKVADIQDVQLENDDVMRQAQQEQEQARSQLEVGTTSSRDKFQQLLLNTPHRDTTKPSSARLESLRQKASYIMSGAADHAPATDKGHRNNPAGGSTGSKTFADSPSAFGSVTSGNGSSRIRKVMLSLSGHDAAYDRLPKTGDEQQQLMSQSVF